MRLIYQRDHRGVLQGHFVATPDAAEDHDVLELAECRAILARNQVGRLAFVRYDQPIMLPVNYTLDDDGNVVFRTARGSKLWVAENAQMAAAFEVDEFDRETGRGAAVVVRGPMAAVTEQIEVSRLQRTGLTPYADSLERDRWVRVTAESIEGWQLVAPSAEARA